MHLHITVGTLITALKVTAPIRALYAAGADGPHFGGVLHRIICARLLVHFHITEHTLETTFEFARVFCMHYVVVTVGPRCLLSSALASELTGALVLGDLLKQTFEPASKLAAPHHATVVDAAL